MPVVHLTKHACRRRIPVLHGWRAPLSSVCACAASLSCMPAGRSRRYPPHVCHVAPRLAGRASTRALQTSRAQLRARRPASDMPVEPSGRHYTPTEPSRREHGVRCRSYGCGCCGLRRNVSSGVRTHVSPQSRARPLTSSTVRPSNPRSQLPDSSPRTFSNNRPPSSSPVPEPQRTHRSSATAPPEGQPAAGSCRCVPAAGPLTTRQGRAGGERLKDLLFGTAEQLGGTERASSSLRRCRKRCAGRWNYPSCVPATGRSPLHEWGRCGAASALGRFDTGG